MVTAGRSHRLVAPLLCGLVLAHGNPAAAQSPSVERNTIEEITVIGRYPGPPLWKVASGEHVLWIFGELSPVPKELDWDPRNAERVIDNAAVVIGAPRVSAPTFLGRPIAQTRVQVHGFPPPYDTFNNLLNTMLA